MDPQFNPGTPLLSLYPKELKSAYYSDTISSMFIAAQFMIATLCNQCRFSSIDEWIKKLCYIYTMEYYSAIQKNKIMAFTGKWMELEDIMLIKYAIPPKPMTVLSGKQMTRHKRGGMGVNEEWGHIILHTGKWGERGWEREIVE